MSISSSIKTADFKSEKHVPAIKLLSKDGDLYTVEVSVGAEIAHPNTLEHSISYIDLYIKSSEGPIQLIGKAQFNAHGELDLITEPSAIFKFKAPKGGTLHAVSYCNIHGLWESELGL